MNDRDNEVARMLDEASVHRAIARFADAATLNDTDAFRAAWAEDAEWTIGDPPRVHAKGLDDIVATLSRLRTGKEFFVQFAAPAVVAIVGDVASARGLGHEAARGPGETYYRNHYVVFDRLRRAGDDWVFTSRTFKYLWLDTSPFGGETFGVADGSSG